MNGQSNITFIKIESLFVHGVPNQKYDSHFSCVTPRGLFLVSPTRGHCFLISFSPGCVLIFVWFFVLNFNTSDKFSFSRSIHFKQSKQTRTKKERAEPLNSAMPREQGLEEHSAGFSGVGVEDSGALLSRALLSCGASRGLLVIAPRSAS